MKFKLSQSFSMLAFLLIVAIFVIIYFFRNPGETNGNEIDIRGVYELLEGQHHQKDGDIICYPIGTGIHRKIITRDYIMTVWDDNSEHHSSIYPGYNFGKYEYQKRGAFYIFISEINIHKNLVNYKQYCKMQLFHKSLILSPCDERGSDLQYGFFEEWKKIE